MPIPKHAVGLESLRGCSWARKGEATDTLSGASVFAIQVPGSCSDPSRPIIPERLRPRGARPLVFGRGVRAFGGDVVCTSTHNVPDGLAEDLAKCEEDHSAATIDLALAENAARIDYQLRAEVDGPRFRRVAKNQWLAPREARLAEHECCCRAEAARILLRKHQRLAESGLVYVVRQSAVEGRISWHQST
jgi:hypothetical protein